MGKRKKSRKGTKNKPAVRKVQKKQEKIEEILEKREVKKRESYLLDFVSGFLKYRRSVLEEEYEKADSCFRELEEMKKRENFGISDNDLNIIKCAVIYKNPEKDEKRTVKELNELESRISNRR